MYQASRDGEDAPLRSSTTRLVRKGPDGEWLFRCLVSFAIWAIFLLIGTVFYTYYEEYGWARGHYYAVNVGLNIGWNWDLEESDGSKVFSIFYLLLGYFLLALMVLYLGELVINRQTTLRHDTDASVGEQDDEVHGHGLAIGIFAAVWVAYVAVGVIWSTLLIDWSVLDGFYFALSSLSAGGMYTIPDTADDYIYGLAGIYTAVGIPIMVLTFALLASYLLFPQTNAKYSAVVTDRDRP